jgi:pimeloyl-ACP methyl ester carboxylesterase
MYEWTDGTAALKETRRTVFFRRIIPYFPCIIKGKPFPLSPKEQNMPKLVANGIRIEYDTFGDPTQSPLVLIQGLGVQMIYWDESFCRQLADGGHFVVRFDNRDIGLSQKFENFGVPDIPALMAAAARGEEVDVPYTLNDMADDAVCLMRELGIEKAHYCGISMGGIIAQTIAARHADRTLSLISIMSGSGDLQGHSPKPEIMQALLTPSPDTREAYIEHNVDYWRLVGSPVFEYDEAWIRRRARSAFDRSVYPYGKSRQMLAIISSGNRKERLKSITAPTLIIHGREDPLVPVEAGMDLARTIPGSRLEIIEGMGHDIPEVAWPRIVQAIREHARNTTP